MTAATKDRNGERNPSDVEAYSGVSGQTYYKETMIIRDGAGVIKPATVGAGASQATFLGVMYDNAVVGVTNIPFNVWKTGEFTFNAQGTGASTDIGLPGYIIDDQTVGVSVGFPRIRAGEITGIPTTSTYRVRISNAVGAEAETVLTGLLDSVGIGASGTVLGTNGTGLTWIRLGVSVMA